MDIRHSRKFKIDIAGIVQGDGAPHPVMVARTAIRRGCIASYLFVTYDQRMFLADQARDSTTNGSEILSPALATLARSGSIAPAMLRLHAFSAETGRSWDEVDPLNREGSYWHSAEDNWIEIGIYAPVFIRLMGLHFERHAHNARTGATRDILRAMGIASGLYALSNDDALVLAAQAAPVPA